MAHEKNAAIEQRVIDQAHYFVHAAAPHFDKFKAYLPAVIVDSFNGLRQAVDQHDEAAEK